ncbi:MAG: FecCD family ABC transporter permease [Spirochaeta sp.]
MTKSASRLLIPSSGSPHVSAGWVAFLLVAGIAIAAGASLAFGARIISLGDIIDGLFRPEVINLEAVVVRRRLVRTIFSLMAGSALGVSGALMKAITRNPIADPSVLGVNTGASLFVVWGIAYLGITTAFWYVILALAGAGAAAVIVYGMGSMGRGGTTPIKLALAGASVSAAFSSLISAIMLPRSNVMNEFRFWQVGSTGGATWEGILQIAPLIVVAMVIAFFSAPALNALALGDEAATGLGVRVGFLRLINAVAGVVLCGAITALAGPIGFIGLMASHVVRLLVGPDLRKVLPLAALGGACILTIADITGRLILRPRELEVGIVTAFLGAPLLIYIATHSRVRAS